MKRFKIQVYNEIGKLKRVLLHSPGDEIENIVPNSLTELLFDEIAFLQQAKREHMQFANIFLQEGVEVVYLQDLMVEALSALEARNAFVDDFLTEGRIESKGLREALKSYLMELSLPHMINKCIVGIRKEELQGFSVKQLADVVRNPHAFYLNPIPNMYFQRDPFTTIGEGVTINVMHSITRNRETLFAKYLFDYHPDYINVPRWYNRDNRHSIEGGDILVLSDEVVAIGISQRTEAIAIQEMAEKLFSSNESFKVILAFDIPKARAYMHLDTVFTMVDYDQFTIYPGIESPLDVYSLVKTSNNSIEINYEADKLSSILKKYLKLSNVNLIKCGDNDAVAASREQWSDGSNTLAVSPGKVICYNRNHVTNKALRRNGIEVLEFDSYELSRGRGGPRCMSMPLVRDRL